MVNRRARSTANSDRSWRSRAAAVDDELHDDMRVTLPSETIASDFRFVTCDTAGCMVSSAFGHWDAMTLRCGFTMCTKHLATEMIEEVQSSKHPTEMTVVIFYDLLVLGVWTPFTSLAQPEPEIRPSDDATEVNDDSDDLIRSPILEE
jgi:hypothetical protein